MGSDCDGRGAEDLEVEVPVGTLIFDKDSKELIADLAHDQEAVLIAKGGKGGVGNMHFATSTNRAPRIATTGEPGVKKQLKLELKLLADIGLVAALSLDQFRGRPSPCDVQGERPRVWDAPR